MKIKEIINEGSAQKGFEYEKNVAKILKVLGLMDPSDQPALDNDKVPDIMLNGTIGCELKMRAASAGSASIIRDKSGNYSLMERPGQEFDVLKRLADFVDLDGLLKDPKNKIRRGKRTDQSQMSFDFVRDDEGVPSIIIDIGSDVIPQYYKSKNCKLINIGTHGLYSLVGAKGDIPNFSDHHVAKLVIRNQSKGGGRRRLIFELQFEMIGKKSNYNIGPVSGRAGDSTIKLERLSIPDMSPEEVEDRLKKDNPDLGVDDLGMFSANKNPQDNEEPPQTDDDDMTPSM